MARHEAVRVERDRGDLGLGERDRGGGRGTRHRERSVPVTPAAHSEPFRLPVDPAGRSAPMADCPSCPRRPRPPSRPQRPVEITTHGDTRVDPFYWLRDRDDPAVRRVPRGRERVHRSRARAHRLVPGEAVRRDPRRGCRRPTSRRRCRFGPWDYFARTVEDQQYAIHGRRPAGAAVGCGRDGPARRERARRELAVLRARRLRDRRPRHGVLAYSMDFDGSERFSLRFRDLATGEDLARRGRGRVLRPRLGRRQRDDLLRPARRRGAPAPDLAAPARDRRVARTSSCSRTRTSASASRSPAPRSGRYLLITTESKTTSEAHFLPAATPDAPLRVVQPRVAGVEYFVEHHVDDEHGDRFFVVTNADGARDFKVMVTDVDEPGREHWTEFVPHRPGQRVARRRRVRRARRRLVARRRARAAARPPSRRRSGSRHRAARPGVRGVGGREPRLRHDDDPVRLLVARHAQLGLRLRPRDPRVRRW